ncbi:MAG: BamA/TamA family outer membrane protein [Balneolaceae bacterium]
MLFGSEKAFSFQNLEQIDEEKVVRKIRFTGNDNVRTRTLRSLIRTRTNREMLGIPRFAPWYYIHQLTGRFGESPVFLNRETTGNDIERIELYYENIGYFEATIDTSIVEYRENRVEVTFLIEEGPASEIRTVSYTGLPDFEDIEASERFYGDTELGRSALDDSSFYVGRQYNAQQLRSEQSRIISYLKNNGYASVGRDSVRALIKRDETDPLVMDILFQINPGRKYVFGDLFIQLAGPDDDDDTYDETRVIDEEPDVTGGKSIYMEKQESAQTRFNLLTEQILFTPGETFNNSLYLQSVNEFQNLGMLTIRGFGLSEDGSMQDFSGDQIPVYFDLQTLPKHSVRSEFFGMRRYGFGTGAGLNYSNSNLFGRAENLTLGFNANLEMVTSREFTNDITFFNSYQARADYSVPRLNFPFARLDRRPFFTGGRTRYQLTYGQSNQPLFDINSDVRFNLRYEVSHTPRFSSFLDLIQLDIIDADPSQDYLDFLRDQFRREPGEPDEVVEGRFEFQRILEDFRPQFSSIIRYTFRSQNTNLIKRNYGYFSEYSFAVGGNMPYLIDRHIFSPGEIQGTLPSPLGLSQNALGYSQFFKTSADYRKYFPIGPDAVFAIRGFAGYAHPYNKSETIPLSRRFFAGGSNDIRGWAPFRLGPGEIEADSVTVSGGEIKLAAFTEVRQIMFENILNADWYLAWFTDAGNIWYGPRNDFNDEEQQDLLEDGKFFFNRFYDQIAVGTGLGLRLDWDFIVARVDFTFRAHDLQLGWFNNRRAYFSFGIGHSF